MFPDLFFKGLNAGVMLLDLKRMRESNWEWEITNIYHKYYKQIVYSDQDIINIFFATHPGTL